MATALDLSTALDLPTRRRGRSARLARCLAALVLAASGAAAGAQTITLVSNTDLATDADTNNIGTPAAIAQSFTTGSAAGGYVIESVDVVLGTGTIAPGTTLSAAIYSTTGTSNEPDAELHALGTLTGLAAGVQTFTAPAATTLAADTTYALVFTATASVSYARNGDNSESEADTGWSIRDNYHAVSGSSWNAHSSQSMLIAVKGQAVPTLVSNTGQDIRTTSFSSGNQDKRRAQGFSTGPNAGGYHLASVGVHIDEEDFSASEALTVLIYTMNTDGSNGTLVHTLTSPDTYTDGAVNVFAAPDGATLAASTNYLVVFSATGNAVGDLKLSTTNSDAEDAGAASGWSIENAARFDGDLGTGGNSLLIDVKGTPVSAPAVQVDITSNADVIGAGVDNLVFTLTRAGATTAEYTAIVEIAQDEEWLDDGDLEHEVDFDVDESVATLTLQGRDFSFEPTSSGNLTATVGEGTAERSKTVEVVSRGVAPFTVGLDMPAYTFAENATSTPIVAVARLHADYPRPLRGLTVGSFSTRSGTAEAGVDFAGVTNQLWLAASAYMHDGTAFEARRDIGFAIIDDPYYEGPEDLSVIVEPVPGLPRSIRFARPDGTTCDPAPVVGDCGLVAHPVTITDDEFDESPDLGEAFLDVLAVNNGTADLLLSPAFAPARFHYAAEVLNATAQVTVVAEAADADAAVEFVDANGDAAADADGVADGHQVDLAVGANVVRVRVTAADGAPVRTYQVTVTRRDASVSAAALVSNTTLTPTTGSADFHRQHFTTGSAPGGYWVTGVEMLVGTTTGRNTVVRLGYQNHRHDVEEDDLQATTVVATLANPDSFTADALNTFTAPEGVPLAAGLEYFVLVNDGVTSNRMEFRFDPGNGESGQPGWSINNDRSTRDDETDPWGTDSKSLVLAVQGAAANTAVAIAPNREQIVAGREGLVFGLSRAADSIAGDLPVTVTIEQDEAWLADDNLVHTVTIEDDEQTALLTLPASDFSTAPDADGELRATVSGDGVAGSSATVRILREAPLPVVALVSNVGQAHASDRGVGDFGFVLAQGFTTGGAGYTLSGVEVEVRGVPSGGATALVAIHVEDEDSPGEPGESLYALASPPTLGRGRMTFTAPPNATLEAGTDYFVVLEALANSFSVSGTASDAEDAGAASGWSILDVSRGSNTGLTWNEDSFALRIAIHGTEVDDVAPRVASIERADDTPTNADRLSWTVTFSEEVENVDASDFAVAGTTAAVSSVLQATLHLKSYSVFADGGNLAGLNGNVTLSFATGQDIEDGSGNALENTEPTGDNEHTYVVDNERPGVETAVPVASSGPFQATFTFTEDVTGFGLNDIAVTNGTRSTFAGSGDTYTAQITPQADGAVHVDVAAGAAEDAAGNSNTAAARATSTYTSPPTENRAPRFDEGASTTRSVAEDAAPGTDIGTPVRARDADGDTLTYTLEGPDAGSFGIDAATGQLRTSAALDRDAKASHSVRVKADDGEATATIAVTINVLEEDAATREVSMDPVTVYEGETAEFTISIRPPPGEDDDLRLSWDTRETTDAREGRDFRAAGVGDIRLAAGQTEVTGEVETLADNRDEATERFQIRMSLHDFGTMAETVVTYGSIYIRDGAENAPPEFAEGAAATRRVSENTPAGRALGKPFTAEDHNDDPVDYALEGADAASFDLDRNTGQLRTRAALDHEARDAYAVVVKAQDDHGGEATIEVAVAVDDVREQPATPAAPLVATASDRGGALDVSWTKPGLAGGPEIVGYGLRWKLADDPDSGGVAREYPAAARSARLDGLREDAEYVVRVRALNGETPSEWSEPGTGRTGPNRPPVFAEGASTTRSVAENATTDAVWEPLLGEPVVAEDPEGDHVTYSLAGPDGDRLFRIDSQTGQLRVRLSTSLNHEAKASYVLTVRAEATLARAREDYDDRDGGSAEIEVTVNVEDVEEPPGTPRSLRVWTIPGSATSVSASWIAGENKGPRMAYDVRYREADGGSWTDGPNGRVWTSAVLTGLSAGVEYEVQARARSDEGESGWSKAGAGSTDPDGAERSVAMDPVSVHEGETARFSIEISPAPEAGDDLRMTWSTRGTAEAREGEDFRGADGGDIRLAAGQTEVTGEVETLADDRDEGRERFQIAIALHDWGGVDPSIRIYASIWIEDGPRPASTAPAAWVAGDRLTLRYGDALEAGPAPGPKDWVVRAETAAAARTLAVAAASVSGREVVLELAPPAAAGESVSVSYLPWSMHPLRGADGAELAPLTELEARNETPPSAPAGAPRVAEGAPGAAAAEPAARDAAGPLPLPPLAASSTRLDLAGLGLADAAALAGLAELEVLDLSGNRLADAWPLAGLGALRRLDLSDNRLADVAALAGLSRLEVLDLSGNAVADAWPLAGLAALRRLDLSDNRLADVAALADLPNLEVLVLDGNRVADVLPLALLPRLARLDLSGNRVADALLLAELRALARLDLAGNRLADAEPLGDLSRLVWLDLSGNPVSDLAPLGRLAALRWLWLDAARAGSEALAPLRERPEAVRIGPGAPAGQDAVGGSAGGSR